MDKEKIIAKIMQECEADGEPVTREEAEEMAEMEIKAKGLKNYVSDKTTPSAIAAFVTTRPHKNNRNFFIIQTPPSHQSYN